MPSYTHTKLMQKIKQIDEILSGPEALSTWIQADQHLHFLRKNTTSDEIVIYGSGPYSFVHSIVVPNKLLVSGSPEDLLSWSCNPYNSIASYVYGDGRENVWMEREETDRGSKSLNGGRDLIFGRTFEGWVGSDRDYFEVSQEYSHLAGIHWRPEHKAYCRFDENGDIQHVVSISVREDDVSLASFEWRTLEIYLAIADCSLVRMFDFTLLDRKSFSGWPDGPEQIIHESDGILYRQKIAGNSAYTRGVQIINLRRAAQEIMSEFKNGGVRDNNRNYVEFIAQDWRNDRVTKISPKFTYQVHNFQAGL